MATKSRSTYVLQYVQGHAVYGWRERQMCLVIVVFIWLSNQNRSQNQVNFWDLSGHPEFFEVRNEFYKDSQGVMTPHYFIPLMVLRLYPSSSNRNRAFLFSMLHRENLSSRWIIGSSNARNMAGRTCQSLYAQTRYIVYWAWTILSPSLWFHKMNCFDPQIDNKRAVSEQEGKNWAAKHGFTWEKSHYAQRCMKITHNKISSFIFVCSSRYFETSASTGDNVTEVFQTLFRTVVTSIKGNLN